MSACRSCPRRRQCRVSPLRGHAVRKHQASAVEPEIALEGIERGGAEGFIGPHALPARDGSLGGPGDRQALVEQRRQQPRNADSSASQAGVDAAPVRRPARASCCPASLLPPTLAASLSMPMLPSPMASLSLPLIGTPSSLSGGDRPASAASGALSLARNSRSPDVLSARSRRRSPGRGSPATHRRHRTMRASPALRRDARRLDQDAAGAGAAADAPSGSSSPATLPPSAEFDRGRDVRASRAPSVGAAIEARIELCTARRSASPSTIRSADVGVRPPNVIDPAETQGRHACPRPSARPECGRNAEQLDQRRDAGRGIGPGNAAHAALGARAHVVHLALELQAVAFVARQPQLQLRRWPPFSSIAAVTSR